jgi:hypothetical protein
LIEVSARRLKQSFSGMKQFKLISVLISYVLLASCAAGCVVGNVNPSKAGANTGYVDFRADQSEALCWQVAMHDDRTQNFKVIYSELSPPSGGFLRLAFAPGHYQLQIIFLNRVVGGPGLIEVEVVDGKITPVQVNLVPAGTSSVQRTEQREGMKAGGFAGRKTKLINDESVTYQVSVVATAPLPYQPK